LRMWAVTLGVFAAFLLLWGAARSILG
jgi:hypothetical protein